MQEEDFVERRESSKYLTQLIEGLIETLEHHMHEEEKEVKAVHLLITRYFEELDAHTHKYHHEWAGDKIQNEKDTSKWWSDVKKSIVTYIAIAAMGAAGMWIAHKIWEDVEDAHNHKPGAAAIVDPTKVAEK